MKYGQLFNEIQFYSRNDLMKGNVETAAHIEHYDQLRKQNNLNKRFGAHFQHNSGTSAQKKLNASIN